MPSIAHELHLHEVPGSELEAVIGSVLSHGRLDPGSTEVIYSPEQSGECALSLQYSEGVLVDVQTGPAFSDELRSQLVECVERLLLVDEGTVVRRDIWFSLPKMEGYWRHGETLQMLPAPPDAPGVPYVMGDHPFVIEARVRHSSDGHIAMARAVERLRELHLVLSLVCMGRITRTSPSSQKHWVMVWDRDDPSVETRYGQEGYFLTGFVSLHDEFSSPEGIEPLKVVPTREYFAQPGIGSEPFALPDVLPLILDKTEAVDESIRERFFRACYWLDQSSQVWSHSRSLSYLSRIMAIETLALHPAAPADPCTACGKDRSPGPTARFKSFIEEFASALPSKQRAALYKLRSQLSHGHLLLESDERLWGGGLDPKDVEQMDLHRTSSVIARVALINWLLTPRTDGIGYARD